ncbi:Ubiquinone/menaquinone biosynthesis C-methylase UbiE [Thermanaeromonas toyohensis ToBE]|uniref:Arsenite methyltransferase n=1 Tax=Thermanaeromonas toyohensis ToBE TaxID=698762 RepID=A0A1W1VUL3_9FIRM|nr:arsenite methyltransferase [Thermanaeromonas toyohensis]SMB97016.1 Ubiquinone/menaquinone biosynthesis C-methylase UbiE [Thermanaeromonas toyohensis ToBE]
MSDSLKKTVKERYAAAARMVQAGEMGSCCTAGGCFGSCDYTPEETKGLPRELLNASLGCGNPVALADLNEGEVVLDLGSGAGLDVLLSARRVGPKGKVYGLDMTEEMLALAEEYRRRSGLTNVEFLKGDIENIPLPDNHVDVIISNCVINLAADKPKVFKEAFRVLKPGGRFAVFDMVWKKEVPTRLRQNVEPSRLGENVDLWAGCIAGALTETEYRRLLEEAGFINVELQIIRVFGRSDLPKGFLSCEMEEEVASYIDSLASAFIRARKPEGNRLTVGG